MTLTVYLDYTSQPCRAVAIFLRMNAIEFTVENIVLLKGHTRSPAFVEVNPLGKVPALVEDDFLLTESMAILKYLLSKPGVADHWYPSEARQRARVDEFIAWHLNLYGLRPKAIAVFMQQALLPAMKEIVAGKHEIQAPPKAVELIQEFVRKMTSGSTLTATEFGADKAVVEAATNELQTPLDQYESYFLSRGEFIAGNDVTLADLLAICELMQLASINYDVTIGRPKLAAWMDRVKARLEPHFTEVHNAIFKFSASYKFKY